MTHRELDRKDHNTHHGRIPPLLDLDKSRESFLTSVTAVCRGHGCDFKVSGDIVIRQGWLGGDGIMEKCSGHHSRTRNNSPHDTFDILMADGTPIGIAGASSSTSHVHIFERAFPQLKDMEIHPISKEVL